MDAPDPSIDRLIAGLRRELASRAAGRPSLFRRAWAWVAAARGRRD